MVECNLAKVDVESSNLFSRSKRNTDPLVGVFVWTVSEISLLGSNLFGIFNGVENSGSVNEEAQPRSSSLLPV